VLQIQHFSGFAFCSGYKMATFEGFLVAISPWWLNRRAA